MPVQNTMHPHTKRVIRISISSSISWRQVHEMEPMGLIGFGGKQASIFHQILVHSLLHCYYPLAFEKMRFTFEPALAHFASPRPLKT